MTENELQQLSKDVAEKYGIAPNRTIHQFIKDPYTIWLHQDSARCFDLMVEHYLMVGSCLYTNMAKVCYEKKDGTVYDIWEKFADHNNDKHLATRVAILKALLAKD